MQRISYKITIPILVFFGLIFSSISLVNHYFFRTSALDLGMFNQAVYCFSQFESNTFTLDLLNRGIGYFADHFSPITFLYVPFYWLFGSYGLLILQILAILMGGVGLIKYMLHHTTSKYLPYLVLVQFFCIWGIYTALQFDFHNNVIAAMMLPWLIYYLDREKIMQASVVIGLMLITKENTGLWVAFILAGFSLHQRAKLLRKYPFYMIGVSLLCFLYSFGVIEWVMPYLNHGNQDGFQLSRYERFGNSIPEIAGYFILHPVEIWNILRGPADSLEYSIKTELYQAFLLSGGVAIIVRPFLIICLLPLFVQKALSNDFAFWGINGHYSIEFVPIIAYAVFEALNRFKHAFMQYFLSGVFIVLSFATTIYLIDNSELKMDKTKIRFYSKAHYESDLNIREIQKALALVPPHEPVSAHPSLAPHLVERNKLYHFPIVEDATYIVLFEGKRGTYPVSREDYNSWINQHISSKKYQILYRKNDVLILKR